MREQSFVSDLNENNVFISSVACERRNIDAQKISSYLMKNNYKIINDPNYANYIILITCGATNSVSDLSINLIKKFQKYNAELIVAGCISDTHKEKLESVFDGKIISTKKIDNIDKIFPRISTKFDEVEEENKLWMNSNERANVGFIKKLNNQSKFFRKLTTYSVNNIFKKILGSNFSKTFPFNRFITEYGDYYILISRGCIHNCTYCIIRKAVGPMTSKSLDQCINEFKLGLENSHKNFILEADDVGPYGIDIGSSLPELLKKMTSINGNYTIELRNTHPQWIIKYIGELEEIMKTKKITSLFVSIQSGNNRVLKLMGRPYQSIKVVDAILRLRKINPNLNIGVDLMVGFPTEDEEEFQDTLNLFKKVHFDHGVIFPFSSIEGTKASQIEPKISKDVVNRRMKEALKFLRKNNYFAWRFRRSTGFIPFYTR